MGRTVQLKEEGVTVMRESEWVKGVDDAELRRVKERMRAVRDRRRAEEAAGLRSAKGGSPEVYLVQMQPRAGGDVPPRSRGWSVAGDWIASFASVLIAALALAAGLRALRDGLYTQSHPRVDASSGGNAEATNDGPPPPPADGLEGPKLSAAGVDYSVAPELSQSALEGEAGEHRCESDDVDDEGGANAAEIPPASTEMEEEEEEEEEMEEEMDVSSEQLFDRRGLDEQIAAVKVVAPTALGASLPTPPHAPPAVVGSRHWRFLLLLAGIAGLARQPQRGQADRGGPIRGVGSRRSVGLLVVLAPVAARAEASSVGACASGTNCVSTSSSKSPSNYSPLLDCAGDTAEEALTKVKRSLEQVQGAQILVVADGGRSLRAVVDLGGGYDPADAEFVLLDEPDRCLLAFRVTARTVLPDPPFCTTRGCINGSRVRRWVEGFASDLGYLGSEYGDEDKTWRQIFLH